MAQQRASKRGVILAGVFGAVIATGLFMMIPGASAQSGNGGQGALVLGSNPVGSYDSVGPDAPNVASAATYLQASPNFANYAGYGPYVFGVDATPSSGDIYGIVAAGNGRAAGVYATGEQGAGVIGESDSATGTGVEAESTHGVALDVDGKATFSRSGRLVIAAKHPSATGTTGRMTKASMVLATIQGNVDGVYIQGVTTKPGTSGSFTIHLNKPTPKDVAVVWMVLS